MLFAVKRSLPSLVSVALACVALPAAAQPPAARSMPSLPSPGQNAQPPAQAAQNPPPAPASPDAAPAAFPGPAALPTPQQLYEHVRRGVAVIERGGLPIAIGTVLGNDGRILTSLSGLGAGDNVDVRYADGTAVHAKLGHSDRATDLALLVPAAAKWTDGLQASETDPSAAELRAMLPARGGHLGPTEAGVKGRVDAHARDGEPLMQLLDVDIKGPMIAGTPLLDSTGNVVAVLVRACKGAAPQAQGQAPGDASPWAAWMPQAQPVKAAAAACAPAVFGAPVSTIRAFLSKTPATAAVPAPFLGIRGEAEAPNAAHPMAGVRIVAVAPQSPAEHGGLKADGDVIVAVDGQPIDTPEKLSDAIAKHAPGETVKLLVYGQDKFREVPLVLARAP
jgi:serine protease Do